MGTLLTILGFCLILRVAAGFAGYLFRAQRDCLTCGRRVPDGEALVPRRDLQVCHTCVSDGTARANALREGRQDDAGALADRCEFCGHEATPERPVVMLPRAAMCSDCLRTCRELLDEDAAEARAAGKDVSGDARARPIRIVRVFGARGFRMALRAGVFGLNNPAAYAELEHAMAKMFVLLAAHPIEEWRQLAPRGFDLATPRLGDRTGFIDLGFGDAAEDGKGVVVLEACLPFRFWPFGGWVAVDARQRATDGSMHHLTQDEVERMW